MNKELKAGRQQPELSDWTCYMFGGDIGEGLSWQPLKGKEPNWFWRKMQHLVFGNKWIKKNPL